MLFLLDRLDKSAEEAFCDYHKNEKFLDHDIIKRMSKVTQMIMSSIDYKDVASCRLNNYIYLHDKLSLTNKLCVRPEGKVYQWYTLFYWTT